MAKCTITPEPSSAQEKSFPARYLKVREGFYDYPKRRDYYLDPYKMPAPVPWIQLKGYWLNAAGFAIGTPVRVDVQDGRLVIEVVRCKALR